MCMHNGCGGAAAYGKEGEKDFAFGEDRRHLGNVSKNFVFCFAFLSVCTIFALMIVIRNRYLPIPGFSAINLCGVLFCRRETRITQRLLNHERIHTAQILEMGVVFFYIWYVVEWLVRLPRRGNAYLNISFEREAYRHEWERDYLKHRRLYAWRKYLKKR